MLQGKKHFVSPKENKRSLIIEKSEIDSQIKSINAKIKGIKAKTMKIQKMEAELQSSISKRALDKLSDLGDDNEGRNVTCPAASKPGLVLSGVVSRCFAAALLV